MRPFVRVGKYPSAFFLGKKEFVLAAEQQNMEEVHEGKTSWGDDAIFDFFASVQEKQQGGEWQIIGLPFNHPDPDVVVRVNPQHFAVGQRVIAFQDSNATRELTIVDLNGCYVNAISPGKGKYSTYDDLRLSPDDSFLALLYSRGKNYFSKNTRNK